MATRPRTPRSLAVAVTAASVVLMLGTSANGAPVPAPAPDAVTVATSAAPAPVIVVLKDQLSSLPADPGHLAERRSRAGSAQAPLLAKVRAAGGTHVKSFVVGNAFAATVGPALRAALAADPSVASVVADETVKIPSKSPTAAPAAGTSAPATGGSGPVGVGPKNSAAAAPDTAAAPAAGQAQLAPGICPSDPAKPLLEPEALFSTHTESTPGSPGAHDLADGTGVKVAYIADGLDPNNPDFIRPDGSHAVVDYQDFSGEGIAVPTGGSEAFGDASAMIAQGRQTYDVAQFVNATHPLPAGCTIRIKGIAPGASLVALKAGGESLPNSAILQSIDYAVSVAHVDVLNESFDGALIPDSGAKDTIELFNDMAVAAGVTVTVSSGDAGVTSTIGSPAADPNVIAAGASTDNQLYQQVGYGGAPFSNGTWDNNRISAMDSSGYTNSGRTIDLVAPGESDWSVCTPDAVRFTQCVGYNGRPTPIQPFGGTSQAAPMTAGAAAVVIQAYRDTHQGVSPAPALVKQFLVGTATDLGVPAQEQGAGLLNVRGAVEAARGYQGGSGAADGSTVLVTSGQLDLTGHPGSAHTAEVTVVNTSGKPQTVSAATRTFVPVADAQQTVQIDSSKDPAFAYATTGAAWVSHQVKFTVPPGADRLAASIVWKGAYQLSGSNWVTPVVRLTLLDPSGRYETNTRPQGGAVSPNFGFVDVPSPVAGDWTAVLYTPAGSKGFTGPVLLDTATQRAVPDGAVGPQVTTLAPGAGKTLKVQLTTPTTSGDSSEAVTIASSNGRTTTVPVILRSLVDTTRQGGSFTGTITGGNARAGCPAESFSYAFDVPKGTHDLTVGVTLAADPKLYLQGSLIGPDGSATDNETNAQLDAQGNFGITEPGVSTTATAPAAGRWRFVLAVSNPVSGGELSQSFTGTVGFDQDRASAPGLPDSPSVKLPAGKASTLTVQYTNTTVGTQRIYADGRLDQRVDVPLVPQFGSAAVTLPLGPTSSTPAFLVPPRTDRFTAVAASSVPAQLEITGGISSPDLFGDLKSAQDGSTISVAQDGGSAAQPVLPGYWGTGLTQIGPFGTAGAPSGTGVITAAVHTQAFDPALTSSTNDPYAGAVDPLAPAATPVAVKPGATGSLQVTVTPTGKKGAVVHGVLYLVSAPSGFSLQNSSVFTTGAVLAAIPYSYTVS